MDQGDKEAFILQASTQPEVITQDLLVSLVVNQGPKEEAAEYFYQDEIKLDKVKQIRIEFLNVLHITFLWVLKNIVKLSLSNNAIEKVENIDSLFHLKELNLSFNRIETIENVEYLINLEILLLHNNKISVVEGLDTLRKLQVFSIGNNEISNRDHILYLRNFNELRSLGTKGNPCAENADYFEYAIAFIPQLVYFQYKSIPEDSRQIASEKYQREIGVLKEAELSEKSKLDAKKKFDEHIALSLASYVEYLDEDYFFKEMFENDEEGEMFRTINDSTQEAFENFQKTFCDLCHELYARGLEEHKKRTDDIDSFNIAVKNGVTNVQKEIRMTMDEVASREKLIFKEISRLLKLVGDQNDEMEIFEKNVKKVRSLSEEFNELIMDAKDKFMNNEIVFHRQMKDMNETLKINMADMVGVFLEVVQNCFAQMRNAESEYNMVLGNIVRAVCSSKTEENASMSPQLIELCADRDVMNNNLAATHDVHLQVIDAREDRLVNRLKSWLQNLIDDLVEKEFKRHRRQVLEVVHFVESQGEQFAALHQLKNYYKVDDTDGFNFATLFNLGN